MNFKKEARSMKRRMERNLNVFSQSSLWTSALRPLKSTYTIFSRLNQIKSTIITFFSLSCFWGTEHNPVEWMSHSVCACCLNSIRKPLPQHHSWTPSEANPVFWAQKCSLSLMSCAQSSSSPWLFIRMDLLVSFVRVLVTLCEKEITHLQSHSIDQCRGAGEFFMENGFVVLN